MSVKFTIHVTCDGCGEAVKSEEERRGSFWRARQIVALRQWVCLEKGPDQDQHYCPMCADAVTYDRKAQTAKYNWKNK